MIGQVISYLQTPSKTTCALWENGKFLYLRTRYRSKLGWFFWFSPIHVMIRGNLARFFPPNVITVFQNDLATSQFLNHIVVTSTIGIKNKGK